MKKLLMALIALTVLFINQPTFAGEFKEKIAAEARKAAEAVLKSDFKTTADYTHPKVIEEIGGREKMILVMEDGDKKMRADGMQFESVDIGQPAQISENGNIVSALVPETVYLKVPQGYLKTESQLVAVSENKGEQWYFIDAASLTTETLGDFLPELAGKISLPEKKSPVFTEDTEGRENRSTK